MDNKDYVTDNIIVNGDACKPIVTLFVEHSNNLKLKSNISLFVVYMEYSTDTTIVYIRIHKMYKICLTRYS